MILAIPERYAGCKIYQIDKRTEQMDIEKQFLLILLLYIPVSSYLKIS